MQQELYHVIVRIGGAYVTTCRVGSRRFHRLLLGLDRERILALETTVRQDAEDLARDINLSFKGWWTKRDGKRRLVAFYRPTVLSARGLGLMKVHYRKLRPVAWKQSSLLSNESMKRDHAMIMNRLGHTQFVR